MISRRSVARFWCGQTHRRTVPQAHRVSLPVAFFATSSTNLVQVVPEVGLDSGFDDLWLSSNFGTRFAASSRRMSESVTRTYSEKSQELRSVCVMICRL